MNRGEMGSVCSGNQRVRLPPEEIVELVRTAGVDIDLIQATGCLSTHKILPIGQGP